MKKPCRSYFDMSPIIQPEKIRQSLGTEQPVITDILKAMGSNIGESDDDECPYDGDVSGDTNRQEKSIITPDCS
ncbi:hypothetical protein JTB14_011651 [Gonioctena quinquepunctata]|nr:hypothetical protein JTB14_011651 [Gonioctena quinquepunctata]